MLYHSLFVIKKNYNNMRFECTNCTINLVILKFSMESLIYALLKYDLFLQKKSREESEGEGSAVEILENRPYTDGPHGSGQYTYKVRNIKTSRCQSSPHS